MVGTRFKQPKTLGKDAIKKRLAALLAAAPVEEEGKDERQQGTGESAEHKKKSVSSSKGSGSAQRGALLSKVKKGPSSAIVRAGKQQLGNKGKQALEVVGSVEPRGGKKKEGKKTRKMTVEVVASKQAEQKAAELSSGPQTSAEAQGLRLLHKAVKEQSHMRRLPHQERHDFEYRLRRVATTGVVRLFNALTMAQKAGTATMEEAERSMTFAKAEEKRNAASKEAFLAALRQGAGFE